MTIVLFVISLFRYFSSYVNVLASLLQEECAILIGEGVSKYYFVWEGSKLDHVNSKTINETNKFTSYFFGLPKIDMNTMCLFFLYIYSFLQMKGTISMINLYKYLPHIISCASITTS